MSRIKTFKLFTESNNNDLAEEITESDYMGYYDHRLWLDNDEAVEVCKVIHKLTNPNERITHGGGMLHIKYENIAKSIPEGYEGTSQYVTIFVTIIKSPDYEMHAKVTYTTTWETKHQYYRIDTGFGIEEPLEYFFDLIV